VQGRARKEAQSISVLARSLYGIASRLRASTRWSFWSVACRTFPFGTSRTSILGETTTRSDVRPCTATCTRHEKGTGSQGAGSIDAVPIREQHQSDASPMSGAPILGGKRDAYRAPERRGLRVARRGPMTTRVGSPTAFVTRCSALSARSLTAQPRSATARQLRARF
jgi:hypothetical protein